jgi:CheY-like chemotaxis protein
MKGKLNCIMLIDDDELTNFIHRLVIEKSGYARHIQIAESGRDALDYLSKSETGNDPDLYPSPDLIFLDINMPAMNGWEFLEEYKKMCVRNRIILVMLSTSLFAEDKARAEEMPEISGFENKPLNAEKLVGVIEKYFADAEM